MIKTLKFSGELPELILLGKKKSTFRINDEKNIQKGDEISLLYKFGENAGKEFAKVIVTEVKETTFSKLDKKDLEGHENYNSDKEMYEKYSNYYKTKIGPETKVK
jgi:hypothetical protein